MFTFKSAFGRLKRTDYVAVKVFGATAQGFNARAAAHIVAAEVFQRHGWHPCIIRI